MEDSDVSMDLQSCVCLLYFQFGVGCMRYEPFCQASEYLPEARMKTATPGVVTNVYNPNTHEVEARGQSGQNGVLSEFCASLSCEI